MTVTTIDASALSGYLLEEEGTEKIRKLLIRGVYGTELLIIESSNAILTAVRRRRITEEEGLRAFEALTSLIGTNVKIVKQDATLLLAAYRHARENGWAIYDSISIALAKRLDSSLASKDPKQLENAKKLGVKVIPL